MTNQRITDGQATALLDGRAPEGRDDLQDVAALVEALRMASFEAPPQPNAALAARLDLDRLAWVPVAQGTGAQGAGEGAGARDSITARTTVVPTRRAAGRLKPALGWFTGLG